MVNDINNTSHVAAPVRLAPSFAQKGAGSPDGANTLPEKPAAASTKPNQGEVMDAMKKMQSFAQTISRDLDFSIDEDSGDMVIKVIDSETDEVVRQIPSEEALRIARALEDGSGFLMETKA